MGTDSDEAETGRTDDSPVPG